MFEENLTIIALVLVPFLGILSMSVVLQWLFGSRVKRHMSKRNGDRREPPTPAVHPHVIELDFHDQLHPKEEHEDNWKSLDVRAKWLGAGSSLASILASLACASFLVPADLVPGVGVLRDARVLSVVWPFAIVAIVVTVASLRAKQVLLVAVYAGLALASDFKETFLLYTAAPTLVLMVTVSRQRKAVGPFVTLVFLVVLVCAALGLGLALQSDEYALQIWVVTFVVSFGIARRLIERTVIRWYRAKKFGDRSFQLAFLWIVFCVNWAVTREQLWRAVFAFGAYWLATTVFPLPLRALSLWKRPATLLVLRVFGKPQKAEMLFENVVARWRSTGPVLLIGGQDTAATNLDLDEAWRCFTGKVDELFVKDDADVKARLGERNLKPDPDGRFRVIDFFCYNDTWQETFNDLLATSHAVLVDLSSYTEKKNRGVIFELGELLKNKPLHSFVVITDDKKKEESIHELLQQMWAGTVVNRSKARDRKPSVHVLCNPSPQDVMDALRYAAAAGGWAPKRPVDAGAPEPATT